MYLIIPAVSRLHLELYLALGLVEPLKLESLTMIVCSFMCFFCDRHVFFPIFSLTAMVIGFRERFTNASEDDVPEGEDLLDINIGVATLRTAEREHPMVFRLQSGGTAIVEPVDDIQNLLFDALFGIRLEPDAPIQEAFDLDRLVADIPSLLSQIRDDLIPEEEECFTIRIFPVDVPGRRELFICNDTDSEDGDFFCETTICIRDNDGRFVNIVVVLYIYITITFSEMTDPFRVAFVEKTYTVDESVGAVNVCVNLTHPTRDILDETVNVFVIDDPSSIYIPDGAPLASESSSFSIPFFFIFFHSSRWTRLSQSVPHGRGN